MCSIDVITEELFFSLSADNKVNGNVEKPWGSKQLVRDPAKKMGKNKPGKDTYCYKESDHCCTLKSVYMI